MGVTERVKEILEGYLSQNGYELWHVEFAKSGKERHLTVYIDAEEGIGTDDCEQVSRYLEQRLDAENLIDASYCLIVSSPGMDRLLLTDEHFERYRGAPVDVSLYKGVDGSKRYSGALGERTETALTLTLDDGREFRAPRALVSKVSLQVIV
jgi:ribosome maturation factor RimP